MSGSAIRETLGFLAVVASLVFVGIEIRQNTAVARGQARQDLAALNQEWLVLMGQDAEWNDIYNRAWRDEGELTELESRRATFMMLLNLRRMENVYLQYREGLVDESALSSYGLQGGGAIYRGPRFTAYWENGRNGFDPGFVEFFNQRFLEQNDGS